jgi:hypothetical protein
MDLNSLIESFAKGLSKGLVEASRVSTPTKPPKTQPRARKQAKNPRQMPLPDPTLGATFGSSMDDSEDAVPSVEELNRLFAGNEGMAAFNRQMKMQHAAANLKGPEPLPEAPSGAWNTVPDR